MIGRPILRAVLFMIPSLFGLAHAEGVRIACVGDSITYGHGIKKRDVYSYPAQLGTLLGKGYTVRNFGLNGATMLSRGDNPYRESVQLHSALQFAPDVVVIMLGTNDIKPHNWRYKEDYIADYGAMIERFRSLPSRPKIWICHPVPAFPNPGSIDGRIIKEEVLPMVDKVAEHNSVDIIDLYTPLADKPTFFSDTVHPNAKGAKVVAETVAAALGRRP